MTTLQTVNPFFDVERTELFAEFNGERVSSGRHALLNAENGEMLGIVSPNYKLVEHAEVANVFDEAFQNVPVMEVRDHLNGVTNRWVRDIVLDGDEFTRDIDGKGDTVKAKVRVWNGYDGRTAVGFAVSAWRMVCSNGMFGWKDLFGTTFAHIENDIVDKIRNVFNNQFSNFNQNFSIWEDWSNIPFGQVDFNKFVDFHTKENIFGNDNAYLSEKQAEGIKGLYEPIMNQYGESETKWGSYNVLTAIGSHHTKARKGSNLFSEAYKRTERLAQDFYGYESPESNILVPVSR